MSEAKPIKVVFKVTATARVDSIDAVGRHTNEITYEIDSLDPGDAIEQMCEAAVNAAYQSNVALLDATNRIQGELAGDDDGNVH